MSDIKNWLEIISKNDIHAYNKVSSRDLAVCFNFLQIPDTDTIVMTLSVMKNRIKKNSLDPKSFARLLSCVEDGLLNTLEECETETKEEHFRNIKSQLSSQWYINLCCHRVFFIPEIEIWNTIKNLFNQDTIRTLKSNGIEEVALYVNTNNYDFNAKFY